MTAVIQAQGLTKSYSGVRALDNVSFTIEPGRIVGLIGPNGAGKTTALKAILGLTPYSGTLSVLGHDPYRERDRLMQDVSFIADVATLPRWLRVRDALRFVASIHPRFQINVGDTMRFDVLGRTIDARVTSIRHVDWSDGRAGGFMFVFRPGLLEQAPHGSIAFFRGPEDAGS